MKFRFPLHRAASKQLVRLRQAMTETITVPKMDKRQAIYKANEVVMAKRNVWHDNARADPEFIARGGLVYPYDILGANLDPMIALFEKTGVMDEIERGDVRTVADIGCANGDLSFVMAMAGFDVTAVDFSYLHDQAPLQVATVAAQEGFNLSVVDMSIDRPFGLEDFRSHLVHGGSSMPEDSYDLVICFGLLYHLRNPIAFVESLRGISKRVILGTHLMTHTPNLDVRVDNQPLAYLVDSAELNGDPTNYWVFTELAFHRLAKRAGFKLRGSVLLPNNPLEISAPNRTDLGVRGFVMLERE